MNRLLAQKCQALFLIILFFVQLFLLPINGHAQQRVVVTVGQPNIWSLEQAHYLLARIRERNLGIRNPALLESDLDPNAVNGTRLDALRTLFEAGVSYSQGIGVTNQINRQNLEFNQSRRQELFTRRSTLFNDKDRLLSQIGKLNAEKQALQAGGSANEEAINLKNAEIKAAQDEVTALDTRLANINSEIALVGGGSSELTNPAPQAGPGGFSNGMGDRIGKALVDEFAKSGAQNPRLAASIKVDNYVQMQYELLAKQLTLLRDDVRPNERLVFLELPTSIYATPGSGNEMTAQSLWKVDGYYRENRYAVKLARLRQEKQDLAEQLSADILGRSDAQKVILRSKYNRDLRETNEEITQVRKDFYEDRAEAIRRGGAIFSSPEDRSVDLQYNDGAVLFGMGDFNNAGKLAKRLVAQSVSGSGTPADPVSAYLWANMPSDTKATLTAWQSSWSSSEAPATALDSKALDALAHGLNKVLLGSSLSETGIVASDDISNETRLLMRENPAGGNQLIRLNRMLLEDAYPDEIAKNKPNSARAVDLIPRQSSLNVSDLKEVVKETGFKALFSLLIGIGGSVNYQKRREQFEQFQQQEVYAAGFGKGDSTFGWTFAPMPGTKRLAPGIRTTYAVMVVPRDATKIRLKAQGHCFATNRGDFRKEPAGDDVQTITLDIPDGPDEGFFVSRIDYPAVAVNQRSVVVLRGDFSNQTGVLINGTSLTRTVGVASPWLGSEKEKAGAAGIDLGEPDSSVKGYYEVINANHIIMVFLMPKDFKGTPQITMVSPGRARSINDLTLNINGDRTSLKDYREGYVIGSKAADAKIPLSISNVEVAMIKPSPSPSPSLSPSPSPSPNPSKVPVTTVEANVNLTIAGIKDSPDLKVYFNAAKIDVQALGGNFYNFKVDLPLNAEKVTFTIVQGKEVSSRQIDNPVFAKVIVSKRIYEIGDEENPDDDTATLSVEGLRIADLDFNANSAGIEIQGRSFNQGVIYLTGLATPQTIVRITDRLTGESLPPITISKQPPKRPKPQNNQNGRNNDSTPSAGGN